MRRTDGYVAKVKVEWGPITDMDLAAVNDDALLFGCLGQYEGLVNDQYVTQAVVVRFTAEFPQVNGFDWPAGEALSPYAKVPDMNPMAPKGCSGGELSPEFPAVEVGVVTIGKKSPAHPNGDFEYRLDGVVAGVSPGTVPAGLSCKNLSGGHCTVYNPAGK